MAAMLVEDSPLGIPKAWGPLGNPGTPEPTNNPEKGDKSWTVGTLLETIVTSGGFSQGHVPDAQEAETLAAQAEQVAEQLGMKLGSFGEAEGEIYYIIICFNTLHLKYYNIT